MFITKIITTVRTEVVGAINFFVLKMYDMNKHVATLLEHSFKYIFIHVHMILVCYILRLLEYCCVFVHSLLHTWTCFMITEH